MAREARERGTAGGDRVAPCGVLAPRSLPAQYTCRLSRRGRETASTWNRARSLVDGDPEETGLWKWEDNPFVGTPPYRNLLVVLIVSNGDMKDE